MESVEGRSADTPKGCSDTLFTVCTALAAYHGASMRFTALMTELQNRESRIQIVLRCNDLRDPTVDFILLLGPDAEPTARV